jgi:hypothetical protein
MPLLDSWMPHPDVAAAYTIDIAAPIAVVYEALCSTDFARVPLVVVAMGVRLLPAVLVAPAESLRKWRARRDRPPLPLQVSFGPDFVLLEQQPPVEMVLGLTGRFWTPNGGVLPTDPATFRDLPAPGTAQAAWSFRLESVNSGHTRLITETRVRCADADSLTSFRRYWRIVGWGSGVIRWALLREIRRQAESTVGGRR